MPELDEELVRELREQLEAEKKVRDELVEELRASRKKDEDDAEPTGVDRIRKYHADQERKRKEAADE